MNDMDEADWYTRLELLSDYYFDKVTEVKDAQEYAELGWYVLEKTLEILEDVHVVKHSMLH